jgi:hypothetical protein
MFLQNTAHPLPDIIVSMRHWRNLRNSVMTSAQVYLARTIRVTDCGPSQVWSGIHLPIVASAPSFLQDTSARALLSAAAMRHAVDVSPGAGSSLRVAFPALAAQPQGTTLRRSP